MLSATELLRDEVRARDEASSTADERTAFNCDHARRGTETKERRTPLSSSSECNAMVVSQSNSRFDFFPPLPPPSFKSCSQFYSKIRGLFKNNFHLQRRQEGTKLAKIFVAFFVLRDGKTWNE